MKSLLNLLREPIQKYLDQNENLIAQIDCLFIPDEIINMSDFNSKIFIGKFQIWNKILFNKKMKMF